VEATAPSRTAVAAAFYRAQHHRHDQPAVFDDPYAHRLLTAAETAGLTARLVRQAREAGVGGADEEALLRVLRTRTAAPFVLARARFTEDRLAAAVARGVAQYVLVGAGLDTFAWRRSDLRDRVTVFELDHPQSQAFKRERLAAAGLADPPNLHFGAVDFERESVADALGRLPFRADRPAVFAWLGVTMYLTRAAIEHTWRTIRAVAAPGSELAFDFVHPDVLSDDAPARVRQLAARLRAVGEPLLGGIDPARLPAELAARGWTLLEHLDAGEIHRRWFAMRAAGWVVGSLDHLACAGPAAV
jgi:methyltransferase (TIGR00027 family)